MDNRPRNVSERSHKIMKQPFTVAIVLEYFPDEKILVELIYRAGVKNIHGIHITVSGGSFQIGMIVFQR